MLAAKMGVMGASWESFAHEVMSGRDTRGRAGLLRALLRMGEVPYAAMMSLRNQLFDHKIRAVHPLGRPTISVGNLTAGGTGKTPMVVWLAQRLLACGHHPAVLIRGYRRRGQTCSDEAAMLTSLLGEAVAVEANPDRVAGAAAVLARRPDTNVFILDDGFQHRRAQRDFDLLLVNARQPFGHGHIHPRGLLRESLPGMGRAHAVVLTRSDSVSEEQLKQIEQTIRLYHPAAPIYRASHMLTGLRRGEDLLPLDQLRQRRFFAFGGIGDPQALQSQLESLGSMAGCRWYADHHAYTPADMADMEAEAGRLGAEWLVTTEKDWAKLTSMASAQRLPVWRLQLEVRFPADQEAALFAAIARATGLSGHRDDG